MSMLVNSFRSALPANLSDLFANGETGDWWRFDVANTDATTTPENFTVATGLVNGLLLEDADPANVPNTTTISGNEVGHFNGPSDRLLLNFGSTIAQPGTIIISLSNTSVNTSRVIVTGSSTTLRWQISVDGSSNVIGFAGATLDSTINVPIGAKVLTYEFNGASSKIRINGTQTASGNMGTQGTNQLTVGSLYDGTIGPTEDIFSVLFINRLLTSGAGGELDRAERLLGSHQGLTW